MDTLRFRPVFVIQSKGEDQPFEVYSNRQLVWRWVEDAGLVFAETGSKRSQLTSYWKLCRLMEKHDRLRLVVVPPGSAEVEKYVLTKAPVISK